MSSTHPPSPERDPRTHRFLELFSQNENSLKRYIIALLPNLSEADDVFAETNVRLWEQFDQYDESKDFRAWACTIAYYQVLTRRKEMSRRGKILGESFLNAVADEAAQRVERSDRRMEALRMCLQRLSQAHHQLIDHYYSGGSQIAQIAESLGQSTEAVKTRLSRIRHRLHKCVEGELVRESQS